MMASNDTIATVEVEDFFEDLYSDSSLKQFTIGIFFFGAILGVISEIGIIWYERNGDHNYRTVLNQLFSTISWVTISYLVLVYIPEGIRFLNGPLPELFCDFHNFLKNFLTCCFILLFDSIICLRYIFIFKWGKFSVFDENLVAIFVQVSILTLSLWMALVKKISIGRNPLNYYMCCGKNPDEGNTAEEKNTVIRKYDTTGILVILSFALHLIASTKIFLYQRNMEKRSDNVVLGRMNDKYASENGRNQGPEVAWENRQEMPVRKSQSFPRKKSKSV